MAYSGISIAVNSDLYKYQYANNTSIPITTWWQINNNTSSAAHMLLLLRNFVIGITNKWYWYLQKSDI